MNPSGIIKTEQPTNISTDQSNLELDSHNVESVTVKKEPLLSEGTVDALNKLNQVKQDESHTDLSKTDNADNERNSSEFNPGGSPNQTLKIDPLQKIASDELNTPVVIKTEPEDDTTTSTCNIKIEGEYGANLPSSIKLVAEYQSQDEETDEESMDTTAEKEKEVEVVKEVTTDSDKTVTKVEDVHSDETSDSSSVSSDTESSSVSSSSSVEEDESDREEEKKNSKSDDRKGQQKRKETAIVPEELPTIEYPELVLPEDVDLTELGYVNSIIGQLVVVQSHQGVPALNVESVLFKGNRQAIGAVYDIFGPVVNPLYSVVFNDAADISAQDINLKMPVFYAPRIKDITAYVFTDKLRQEKGSDASWKNDEEPPPELVDYSDDEREREAKNKKKEGKEGGRRRKKPQRRDRGNQEQRGGNERQHHQRGHQREWSRNGPPHDHSQNPRRPPYEGYNRQFGNNTFPNNQEHQPVPPVGSFGQMGNQFPPRFPPPGHQYPPPPPPSSQRPIFPPRPPGFMGDGPPVSSFHNGPPNMGFGNQSQSQFNQEHPYGPPPGPQGPPFPNGDFGTRPMNPLQDSSSGMFGNFSHLWQAQPPPPPSANFRPQRPPGPPDQMAPQQPGFPSFPYTTATSSEGM